MDGCDGSAQGRRLRRRKRTKYRVWRQNSSPSVCDLRVHILEVGKGPRGLEQINNTNWHDRTTAEYGHRKSSAKRAKKKKHGSVLLSTRRGSRPHSNRVLSHVDLNPSAAPGTPAEAWPTFRACRTDKLRAQAHLPFFSQRIPRDLRIWVPRSPRGIGRLTPNHFRRCRHTGVVYEYVYVSSTSTYHVPGSSALPKSWSSEISIRSI